MERVVVVDSEKPFNISNPDKILAENNINREYNKRYI